MWREGGRRAPAIKLKKIILSEHLTIPTKLLSELSLWLKNSTVVSIMQKSVHRYTRICVQRCLLQYYF